MRQTLNGGCNFTRVAVGHARRDISKSWKPRVLSKTVEMQKLIYLRLLSSNMPKKSEISDNESSLEQWEGVNSLN